jgi:hypothetical protein
MMLIERVTGLEFLKDHEITDHKSSNPTAPTITMDVPSTSTSPHVTNFGSATPPPACSSSSSGGLLRVLKSMFAWCCDTRQRQDMLLSNQRCQNEKMDIDEFDKFPSPVPPLDDEPFASLFAADIAANADGSRSEYEEEEEEGAEEDKDYNE